MENLTDRVFLKNFHKMINLKKIFLNNKLNIKIYYFMSDGRQQIYFYN